MKTSATLIAILAGILPAAGLAAAEIRLRAESRPERPIVTLGDLVDLRSDSTSEVERLTAILLFPAPAPGLHRYVSRREIQDMLLIRGIDLIDHQFGGAASVVVRGSEPAAEPSPSVRLASAVPAAARKRLQDAIARYLHGLSSESWEIEFELDDTTARWISAADSLSVQGIGPPTVGRQSFEVTLVMDDVGKTLEVIAHLALPPLVVVPVRSLPREGRIGAADVELRRLERPANPAAAVVASIEEVVGKETTRALAVGKPIERDWVRAPVLVRRGDIVSVYVRSGGIRVRTQARARDEGAEGDLVTVESLTERKSYLACVSGVREVEVLATGVTATSASRPQPSAG